MIHSADQTKKEIKKIWPNFQWDFPGNPTYTDMPDDILPRVIKECSVKNMSIIPGVWECENYARRFQTNVEVFQYNLWQSGELKLDWRWYVMSARGIEKDSFMGSGVHGLNIIRLESGLILFEPQTDIVSKDFELYEPFLIGD
jgi:hypothetical protein